MSSDVYRHFFFFKHNGMDEIIKKLEDEVEITNERLEDAVKIETIKFLQGYREALLTSILIIKDGLKN